MTYALLMAGGIGNRLKANVIKPLLPIKGKALFTYALDVFTNNKNINKVIIVINNKYVNSFNKILKKYKKVDICFGGTNRQDSLVNGMAHLKNKFDLKPNDIIVTHDCARINIDNKIINDNINVCQKAGFASTVLPISDSICEITNGCKYIDRQNKYLVQTPQTFQCKYWKLKDTTNTTDLFNYLNLKVTKRNLVIGKINNFKITTPADLLNL